MKIDKGAWLVGVADAVALASEDPYCQVGAVLLSKDSLILGTGYNGPPSGVEIDWTDRAERRRYVIHAEANALRLASYSQAKGGVLATTHFPCGPCVRLASAYGVKAVYWRQPPDWTVYPRQPIDEIARVCRVKLIEIP